MTSLRKLSVLLFDLGLITEDQADEVFEHQHLTGMPFGPALVDLGIITEEKIVSVLMEYLGIPYINLADYELINELLDIFDPEVMRRFEFVPLDLNDDGSVSFAVAGILNEDLIETMETKMDCKIQQFLVKVSDIEMALKKHGL